jgi:hypothetical protein
VTGATAHAPAAGEQCLQYLQSLVVHAGLWVSSVYCRTGWLALAEHVYAMLSLQRCVSSLLRFMWPFHHV